MPIPDVNGQCNIALKRPACLQLMQCVYFCFSSYNGRTVQAPLVNCVCKDFILPACVRDRRGVGVIARYIVLKRLDGTAKTHGLGYLTQFAGDPDIDTF